MEELFICKDLTQKQAHNELVAYHENISFEPYVSNGDGEMLGVWANHVTDVGGVIFRYHIIRNTITYRIGMN